MDSKIILEEKIGCEQKDFRLTIRDKMGKISKFNIRTICLWLLPWYPIFQIYGIGGLPLGFFIYTPMLLVMINDKKHLMKDKSLMVLYATLIGIEIIQMALPYTSATTLRNNIIMHTVYLFSILCFSNYVRYDEFLKPFKLACAVFIAGLFYQVIQLFVFHQMLEGPIILFPSLLPEQNIYMKEGIVRPMSFFQEPQAFCSYIIVFVIFMIEEKQYFGAAIASLAILLSTSTEGLVLIVLVWLLYFLFTKSSLWTKIFVAVGAFFVVKQYLSLEIFSVGLEKATNTDYGDNVRVSQGFKVLNELSFGGWLFGMGTANNDFYARVGTKLGFGSDSVIYFSSAAGVIINYGLFVGIAYWLFLLKKIIFKYKPLFILSICLCVMPFAQTCFFSSTFVYLFSLYYLLLRHCREKYDARPQLMQSYNDLYV